MELEGAELHNGWGHPVMCESLTVHRQARQSWAFLVIFMAFPRTVQMHELENIVEQLCSVLGTYYFI